MNTAKAIEKTMHIIAVIAVRGGCKRAEDHTGNCGTLDPIY